LKRIFRESINYNVFMTSIEIKLSIEGIKKSGWVGLTGKRVAAEVRRRRALWCVWGLAESRIHCTTCSTLN